ncbi:hypothetical protein M422DRAFT_272697 [Sphaerobolus stellatus SS14]|uniref:malate dehydrogenase n=1 Tax=Sphaerobolus stellatus (strain SS14) TaxID=990650 RepID=A0A0C9TWM8_SPHS4|nr:hypothetical protein M422DRAFT_272697 [Sphaerobolus stellatus SS14]
MNSHCLLVSLPRSYNIGNELEIIATFGDLVGCTQDRPPICLDGNTRAYLARHRAPPLFILIPFSTFALSASISDNGDDPLNTICINHETNEELPTPQSSANSPPGTSRKRTSSSSPTPSTPLSRAPSKKLARTTPRASSASPPSTSSVRPAPSPASGAPTPLKPPVTVVGGHSGVTIVPLLSQSSAGTAVEQGSEAWKALVHRIQYGGDEVVQAKEGAGSATLSMAYAAAKFTNLLLRALKGEAGIVTPTFVKSLLFAAQGIEFFSSAVELSPNGVAKIHDLGNITAQEQELVNAALPKLKKNIEKGFAFVQ